MDTTSLHLLYEAHTLVERASVGNSTAGPNRPPVYKAIGLTLAVVSGLLIGTSFVLKKTGLLKANEKYNEEAGEGYGYLKNAYWWGGMTLMILGEVCNFVAYAFVDAILVTPLGALSVVVTTILSAIFLKERLSFVGKIGCFNCIIGSIVIVMNAPEQSAVADIQEMRNFVAHPGFLTYAGLVIIGSAFVAFWVAPRYGKKSMMVYLSICSFIGGLSVVATQGLGSAIVAQAGGKPQFNQWFLYVLLVFVVATLLTEIIYLNKALNLFNAALVTPTYYVLFTTATIMTSAILFRGFHGTPVSIATVIMGFLQICAGVVLLQLSKSAKDVPDAAIFKGDLDQMREVAEQEQPETEPKADAIRGTAAIIRRISNARVKMEQSEFKRLREEKLQDHLEPLKENEIVEWDGLRRRKTIIGGSITPDSPIVRRRTVHPPLGMSHFPNEDTDQDENGEDRDRANTTPGFLENIRYRASSIFHPQSPRPHPVDRDALHSPMHPVALTDIQVHPSKSDSPAAPYGFDGDQAQEHVYGLPPALRKGSKGNKPMPSPRSKPLPDKPELSGSPMLSPQGARRQFSFTNFMHRNQRPTTPLSEADDLHLPPSRSGLNSRGNSYSHEQKKAMKSATEEERLGLVKGDSHRALLDSSPERPRQTLEPIPSHSRSESGSSNSDIEDDGAEYARHYTSVSHSDPQSYPRGRYDIHYSRSENISGSDGNDGWQMTTPPNDPNQRPIQTSTWAQPPMLQQSPQQRPPSRKRPSPPRQYQPQANSLYTISNPSSSRDVAGFIPAAVNQYPDHASHSRTRSNHQTARELVTQPQPPAPTASNHSRNLSTNRTHIRMVSQEQSPQQPQDQAPSQSQPQPPLQTRVQNLPQDRNPRPTQRPEQSQFGSQIRRDQSPEDMDDPDQPSIASKKRYELQSAREREVRRKRMSSGWTNPGTPGSESGPNPPTGYI